MNSNILYWRLASLVAPFLLQRTTVRLSRILAIAVPLIQYKKLQDG
jgi:hypothetical protein